MELVYYVMRDRSPEIIVALHRWAVWSTTWPSWSSHRSCSSVSATTTRLATEGSGFKRRTSWTQCRQRLKRYSCGSSERRFCLELNTVEFKPLFILLLFLGNMSYNNHMFTAFLPLYFQNNICNMICFYLFSANPDGDVQPTAKKRAVVSEQRRELYQRRPPQAGVRGFLGGRRHRPTERPRWPHVLHWPRAGPHGDRLLWQGAMWWRLFWRWVGFTLETFRNIVQGFEKWYPDNKS